MENAVLVIIALIVLILILVILIMAKVWKLATEMNPLKDSNEQPNQLEAIIKDSFNNFSNESSRQKDSLSQLVANQLTNLMTRLSEDLSHIRQDISSQINNNQNSTQQVMNELRKDSSESLEKINKSVSSELHGNLEQKLKTANELVTTSVKSLGDSISQEQFNQRKELKETLTQLATEFTNIRQDVGKTLVDMQKSNAENIQALRGDNQRSMDKMNNTVSSELHGALEQKLKTANELVTASVKSLGDSISQEQFNQRKELKETLTQLATEFTNIRQDVSKTLADMQKSNADNIQALRGDNQQSMDKMNNTVSSELHGALEQKLKTANELVTASVKSLGDSITKEQFNQRTELKETLNHLAGEFTNIRQEISKTLMDMQKSNADNIEALRRDNQQSMDKINDTVNEKLQKTLDDRLSQSFESVRTQLKEVYEGLGEMKNVASGVTDLKNVLSNVRARGTIGEYRLEAILAEILTPDQYETQCAVVPKSNERVDFAIKFPGGEDGSIIYLPIDSKFPGESFHNLIDAYDSSDVEKIRGCKKRLRDTIVTEAKSIRDKYIMPPYTTNFAVMFLPFEGLYSEVVNMGLIEELQNDCKVNIAGPSTMAAMLNSLRMGFRTLAIQKRSGEVWKTLEAVKKEFGTFEAGLKNMKNRLHQADNELDKLIGTRTNAINRKLRSVTDNEAMTLEEANIVLEIEPGAVAEAEDGDKLLS